MTSLIRYDDRRDIIIKNSREETIDFASSHFIDLAKKSIQEKGQFSIALSGGGTPKPVYEKISETREGLDWEKVLLFWSDERCVSPDDKESNFKMAMDAGFSRLPILSQHIFRMKAEVREEKFAREYEDLIQKYTQGTLDLVILGMGEDGHVASLFPFTHGLHVDTSDVIYNYVPQKGVWRMTLTMNCINRASHIVIYVMGEGKSEMVSKALNGSTDPDLIPAYSVGTPRSKALWILDKDAAKLL